jgi:hypothetical protein
MYGRLQETSQALLVPVLGIVQHNQVIWMKVKTQNWQLMDDSFNEEFVIWKHKNQQLCRMSKCLFFIRSNYKFLMRKWGDERCPVWHIMVNEHKKIFGDHYSYYIYNTWFGNFTTMWPSQCWPQHTLHSHQFDSEPVV